MTYSPSSASGGTTFPCLSVTGSSATTAPLASRRVAETVIAGFAAATLTPSAATRRRIPSTIPLLRTSARHSLPRTTRTFPPVARDCTAKRPVPPMERRIEPRRREGREEGKSEEDFLRSLHLPLRALRAFAV